MRNGTGKPKAFNLTYKVEKAYTKYLLVLEFTNPAIFDVESVAKIFPLFNNIPKKHVADKCIYAETPKDMVKYLNKMMKALPNTMREYNKFTPGFKKIIGEAISTIQNAIDEVQDLKNYD